MEAQTVEREWFSYAEAEQFAGLSRTTLWRLVGAREIKAARVGRAVRLNRRSLEEYLERQAREFEYARSPADPTEAGRRRGDRWSRRKDCTLANAPYP